MTAFVAATAIVAGCKRQRESEGEVSRNWQPADAPGFAGVPAAEVRSGIEKRLAGEAPQSVNADQWKHARQLYKTFPMGPLWLDAEGVQLPRANALLLALASADSDALRVDRFPVAAIEQALTALGGDGVTADQLAEADVVLTAAYAALGENLLTGEIRPAGFGQAWHINPLEERVDSALALTLREDELAAGLARMRPQDEGYVALRGALAQYRELSARGGWNAVPDGKPLKSGDTDSPIRLASLRQRLSLEGFLNDSTTASVYTPALSAAVAEFQARHGIVVDGMLGKETIDAMNVPVSYRLGQIAVNLERHRWLARSLGERYIIVNVPEFKLQGYDSGQKKLEMKVIVGSEYQERATPVFGDSMEFVVFRPYWNVTDRIAANELWPKADADPGYLARNSYEVVNDHGKRRIRQVPGPKNALGLAKFMFPNDFNIYLHDTPNGELFEKDVRAFSHGCIRVEHPEQLAEFVLGWPPEKVQAAMQGSNDHTVRLPRKLPVYIVYFTTYVRDGRLDFGNDLYDRDDRLVAEMQTVALPGPEVTAAARTLLRLIDGG
jgi:murein L,D-transpeptidase YcbB/YkuD